MKRKHRIGLTIVAVLLLLQFVPYRIVNDEFDTSLDFIQQEEVPEYVTVLLKAACYDCHSYESKTPWYGKVAPLSFWLNRHVRGGRMNLNFSKWGELTTSDREHLLQECADEVSSKGMPLSSYIWMHDEARLTDEQRMILSDFFDQLSHTK